MFAYNIAKRYINVLHFIDFCIFYKTIYVILKKIAKKVKQKI